MIQYDKHGVSQEKFRLSYSERKAIFKFFNLLRSTSSVAHFSEIQLRTTSSVKVAMQVMIISESSTKGNISPESPDRICPEDSTTNGFTSNSLYTQVARNAKVCLQGLDLGQPEKNSRSSCVHDHDGRSEWKKTKACTTDVVLITKCVPEFKRRFWVVSGPGDIARDPDRGKNPSHGKWDLAAQSTTMTVRETRYPIFTGCTILKTKTHTQLNGTRTNHFSRQTENVQMLSRYVAYAHHALLSLASPPASVINPFITQAEDKLNAQDLLKVTESKMARQQSLLIGRVSLLVGLCHRHFEDVNNILSVCKCFKLSNSRVSRWSRNWSNIPNPTCIIDRWTYDFVMHDNQCEQKYSWYSVLWWLWCRTSRRFSSRVWSRFYWMDVVISNQVLMIFTVGKVFRRNVCGIQSLRFGRPSAA